MLYQEFTEAWSHYRQLENIRSQYLGFFFLLTVGSTAFAADTVTSDSLSSPLGVILFETFLAVFALFCTFIYLGVRRAGVVLIHYELAWNRIRDHFYSGVDRREEPYRSLDIRSSDHRLLHRRWTGAQFASEVVVLLISLAVSVLEIFLCANLFMLQNSSWRERGIGCCLAFIALMSLLPIGGAGTTLREGPIN